MADKPLPAELAHFSNLPDLVYRGSNEWSSSCIVCGGATGNRSEKSDRFRLFAGDATANARVWCRQCGHFEWADQDTKQRPSPEQIQQAQDLRRRYAEQEAQRLRAKIDELRRADYWRGYHDAMTQVHRQLWRQAGISDELQDLFKLGYVDDRTFYDGDNPFHSPAMTIPHFDTGWQAVNVQYRIVNPPAGVGKYRYTAGLPAPLFLTEPDRELSGATILLEGAKKAIVTYPKVGPDFNIVAVPSKMPGKDLLDRLADCDPLYLALDPDAYVATKSKDGRMLAPAINRLARLVGSRARIVKLPCKADDMFTIYGGGGRDFASFLKVAARV
jgi:hypothetical protein